VVPRVIAMVVMLPCLTVITDLTAMLGGYLIGTYGVHINPDLYIAKSIEAMVLKDIYTGTSKSVIFAALIALVSCHQGLSVEGGAEGVGKATTQAVVTSIVLIIVVDCLATAVFYYAFP
jgi:phospholipid/cholesterol/gamma-HCH transport system permease protein